ncbi:hypothetical protein GCM10027080_28830 [Pedococcus soli]
MSLVGRCSPVYPEGMAPVRAVWSRGRQHAQERADGDEDVVVRQYRYLLSTATLDALEKVHEEVVVGMSDADRRALLGGLSDAFATGRHVEVVEHRKIAHLIAAGAHRHTRAWLDSLDPMFARRLAEKALDSEAAFGRLNGYAYWDGVSQEPVEDPGPNDGFDPGANRYRADADPRFKQGGGIGGGG